jgi:hypothetical protein
MNSINICGVDVKEEDFPYFYKWAKSNLERAEIQVNKIVESEHAQGNKDFNAASAIIILNSDLAHI